jgi:hypothetical protein
MFKCFDEDCTAWSVLAIDIKWIHQVSSLTRSSVDLGSVWFKVCPWHICHIVNDLVRSASRMTITVHEDIKYLLARGIRESMVLICACLLMAWSDGLWWFICLLLFCKKVHQYVCVFVFCKDFEWHMHVLLKIGCDPLDFYIVRLW